VISWLIPVFGVGISAACLPIAADAPLASDNDNPAALNTGTALMLRFRFVEAASRATLVLSCPSDKNRFNG
jgi:hypothetical protein